MPKFGSINEFGTFKFGTYTAGQVAQRSRLGDGGTSTHDIVAHPSVGKVVFTPGFTVGMDVPAVISSLTGTGGILFRGSDVITQALKNALEETIVSYDLKFYIQDDNSKWVDFTDRAEHHGRNALRKLGNITFSAERRRGQLQQNIGRVVLGNEDGFWDRPMPSSLKATFDENWNSIDPATASFEASFNSKESSFSRHKAAVRAHVTQTGTTTPTTITLGVYLIDEIETNHSDRSATLKFAPLSAPLIEAKAKDVRNGTIPWQNRSSNFLVTELVKLAYAKTDRTLPTGFDIDDIPHIRVPATRAAGWAQGFFGRPPEKTFANDGVGNIATSATWQEPGRLVRAMETWSYTTGTLSITAGSATVTGVGTSWSTTDTNLHNRIKVGDTLIIGKEYTSGDSGSSSGHHGYYTVLSVNSTTSITLNQVPPGTADETGVSYAIVRMYVGAGPSMYEYNIANDTYTELTTSATELGTTAEDYLIRRIWVNTADTDYPIYVAAIRQNFEYETSPCPFKIYKFRWNGSSPEFVLVYTASTTAESITLGDFVYREPDKRVDGGTIYWHIGNFGGGLPDTDQVPITIPFDQTLQEAFRRGTMKVFELDTYAEETTSLNNPEYSLVDRAVVQRGYFAATGTGSSDSLRLKYTVGATGFMELSPAWGDKGTILFANGQDPTVDADTGEDTAVVRTYAYRAIDLSAGTASDVTGGVFTGGSSPSSGTYDAYQHYTPTAGCVDPDGNIYVALTLFRLNASGDDDDLERAAIINITSVSPMTTDEVFAQTGTDGANTTDWGEVFTELMYVANGAEERLYFSVYRQEKEKSTTDGEYRYAIGVIDQLDAPGNWGTYTTKYDSDQILQGIGVIDTGTTASPAPKVFFNEGSEGMLKYVNEDMDANDTPVNAADIPVPEEDSHIFENRIVYIPNVKVAYWISSSLPNFTRTEDETAQFHLSCWSFMYPTRIQLADFKDMNAWEGVNAISEICDARFGFTADGNFFFKHTPRHEGSSYTFTNVGQSRLASFRKGRGHDGIINISNRVPNLVRRGDISVNVELTPDSKYATGSNRHTITPIQRDFLPKTINLRCIKGGSIRSDVSDTSGAEFEYRVQDSTFKTNLSSAYVAPGYSVGLEGIEGLRYGSLLTVSGVDSNDNDISSTGYVGHEISYNSGVGFLRLDGATDSTQGDFKVKLSSGSVDVGTSMDNIDRRIQSNDVLLVGKLDATDPQWEYVIVVQVRGTDTLVVSRGAWGDTPPVAHDDNSQIWLIRNGRTIYLKAALANSHSAGDEVTSDQPVTDKSSLEYQVDPADTSSAASSYNIWKPINDEYVSIGAENSPYDTHISLQLSSGNSDDLDFSVGDRIRIVAEGLILEADAPSVQTAANALSIKKWQRREATNNKNPFMNLLQARWAALRDIQDEAHPRYTFYLDTILAPWVSLLDVVTVQEPDMLPTSSQFSEKAYITAITMSPQTRGAMSVTLRATRPY